MVLPTEPVTILVVAADLLICDRAYTEALFDAFMDVGKKVGMLPTGLSVLPISF